VTSLEVPFRADLGRWSRWRWHIPRPPLPIAIAVLLVGVLAAGVARVAYVRSFQPFGDGNGTLGPTEFSAVQIANDGLADTEYVLAGPPGATATLQYPISNLSDQDVRITGLAPGSLVTSLGWSGIGEDPHAFPMTLKPGQSLTLLVTVTKPSECGEATFEVITGVPIRFEALGAAHTAVLQLRPGGLLGDNDIPIALCVPSSMTVHTGH
jgi:hypothetical protein